MRKQNEKLTSQLTSSTKRVKELNAEVVMLSDEMKRQRSEGKEVFLRKRRVNDGSETAYSQRHQRLL